MSLNNVWCRPGDFPGQHSSKGCLAMWGSFYYGVPAPLSLLPLALQTRERGEVWSRYSASKCKCMSLNHARLRPRGLYSPWDSPGQKTGAGSLSLLQGIFPTQGSNPGLPHCRQILYQLSHKGSPRILKWVASPFSSGPSWPRNRTGVSCIVGRFSTNWAIRAYQFLTTAAHN